MNRNVAKKLLEIKAVELRPENPFTWASGIKSPIYCDNRLILAYPEVREYIENELKKLVIDKFSDVEVLMGTSTAGIPHAAIISHEMKLPMGYVRSQSKDHGKNNKIEGRIKKGDKVVVIEDLISTGGSSLEVVNALKEAGANVLGVVSIFTYNIKRAIESFKDNGVIYYSICDLDTLLLEAEQSNYISKEQIKTVLDFRNSL